MSVDVKIMQQQISETCGKSVNISVNVWVITSQSDASKDKFRSFHFVRRQTRFSVTVRMPNWQEIALWLRWTRLFAVFLSSKTQSYSAGKISSKLDYVSLWDMPILWFVYSRPSAMLDLWLTTIYKLWWRHNIASCKKDFNGRNTELNSQVDCFCSFWDT